MGWTQIGSQFVYISPTNGVILVYSGLPANGNLSISIAAASGVDQFGNSYPAGIGTFGGTSQFAPAITLSVNSADLALASFINMFEANAGAASEFFSAQWFGPEMTGHTDVVSVNLFSNFKDGSYTAQGELLYFSPGGTQYAPFLWNEIGCTIIGIMAGQKPGATVPTADGWNAITMDATWTIPSGYSTPSYRISNQGDLQLTGCANYGSSQTVSRTLNSGSLLPSGYKPGRTHLFRVNGYGGRGAVQIDNTGLITMLANTTYPAQYCEIDATISI